MWATYNYDNFPTVNVTISGIIENDNDFSDFIGRWLHLFNSGAKFNFIFHTEKCGLINIKYAILMAYWIKKFKQKKYKNLENSKILVANHSIIYLLRFIFFIEKPIAPVKVVYIKNNIEISSENFYP